MPPRIDLETQSGTQVPSVQRHAKRMCVQSTAYSGDTKKLDYVTRLPSPYPHRPTGDAKIPLHEMISFLGEYHARLLRGCTFCSITSMKTDYSEPRMNRSFARLRNPGQVARFHCDDFPTWAGHGQTCTGLLARAEIEAACRKPSCVYPGICENLGIQDHSSLIACTRKAAMETAGSSRRSLIASGLRYDLRSSLRVCERAGHAPCWRLSEDAPKHDRQGPLTKMHLKPGKSVATTPSRLFEK